MTCKKEILEKEGVSLLRGINFMCKDCYNKKKEEQKKDAAGESCEFC